MAEVEFKSNLLTFDAFSYDTIAFGDSSGSCIIQLMFFNSKHLNYSLAQSFPITGFYLLQDEIFWLRLTSVHMKLPVFMLRKVALWALKEQHKERKNAEWDFLRSSGVSVYTLMIAPCTLLCFMCVYMIRAKIYWKCIMHLILCIHYLI